MDQIILSPFFQKENPEDVKTDLVTLNVSQNAKLHDSALDSIRDPVTANIPDCLSPDSFANIFAQTSLQSITKVENDPSQVQGYSQSQCIAQKSLFPASIQSSISSQTQNESLADNQNVRRAGTGRPKF